MPTLIFDLNRTLYDPETSELLPDTLPVLQSLKERGIHMHLLSRNEPGRSNLLHEHGIFDFFDTIQFAEEKSALVFASIIRSIGVAPADIYVIGDYLHEDVRFGNQCGSRTVWLKRGKFSFLQPEGPDDEPWKTVTGLLEILDCIE